MRAGGDFARRVERREAVPLDLAGADQVLQAGPGQIREQCDQCPIQPHASLGHDPGPLVLRVIHHDPYSLPI